MASSPLRHAPRCHYIVVLRFRCFNSVISDVIDRNTIEMFLNPEFTYFYIKLKRFWIYP